jgi:hypothetical protein
MDLQTHMPIRIETVNTVEGNSFGSFLVYLNDPRSPAKELWLLDGTKLSYGEFEDIANNIPTPPDHVRLFRGIKEPYDRTQRGLNCFTDNFHIATTGMHPECAILLTVSIPSSIAWDLVTYQRLEEYAKKSYRCISEGGLSVLRLPLDWVNGAKIDEAKLDDIVGLDGEMDRLIPRQLSERRLKLWRLKAKEARRLEDEYSRRTGEFIYGLTREESDLILNTDPAYRAADKAYQAMSERLLRLEDLAKRELTRRLPTLAKFAQRNNISPPSRTERFAERIRGFLNL